MSQKDLLINIIRYVEARYQLDVAGTDANLLLRKASYLARARNDQRLYSYIDQYNAMKGHRSIPILHKKPTIINKNI